jgi:steroid 5-alpha reductase family enzyme
LDILLLVLIAIGLSLAMTAAWAAQRLTGASGWVDTAWSAAVGLGGLAAVIFADGDAGRRTAVFILIGIWSIRLGAHIAARTMGGGEDPRYAKMIADWGASASLNLFAFLQIQALAAFVLVLAVYLAAANPATFPRLLDLAGIAIGIVAIIGEALADRQLARFRTTPAARTEVCQTGLWRYSRHPNYFFEWLGWCAWALLAIDAGSAFVWGWLSLLAPLMMYWLLVHVSGIPPLEAHMLRSRGDRFRAVQAEVNAFFPGPRRTRTHQMKESRP